MISESFQDSQVTSGVKIFCSVAAVTEAWAHAGTASCQLISNNVCAGESQVERVQPGDAGTSTAHLPPPPGEIKRGGGGE